MILKTWIRIGIASSDIAHSNENPDILITESQNSRPELVKSKESVNVNIKYNLYRLFIYIFSA
jgi:hypothetical protein